MWNNGWWAAPDVGPYEREDFGDCLDENNVCTEPQSGNFTARYWSPDTKRAYTLNRNVDYAVDPYQLTKDLVNNQWAPLNVLFDGGFNCTMEGHAGTSNIKFNFDGTLNVACISQLPMLTAKGAPCPAPLLNNTCMFGDVCQLIAC